tara:strand:- start:120 stop:239 length:120 start_codon:yes stop_codon:yes gene_type:complete
VGHEKACGTHEVQSIDVILVRAAPEVKGREERKDHADIV